MQTRLKDRAIIVIGAGTGIGAATVRRLASEGARVCVADINVPAAEPLRPSYAVSKAGINALMRHVASRWGREGITANCVAPGVTITPEMQASGQLPEGFEKMALAVTPHRRLGLAEDIAGVVAMLLSDDGKWINGQVYNVNGGALMR